MRRSITLSAMALLLAGCAINVNAESGDTITQTRDLPAFDKIEASRGVQVTLSCGASPQALVTGEIRLVAETELRVENHVLTVRRGASGDHNRPVQIALTVAEPLNHVGASSGSTIKAPSCAISAEKLDIEASSGGLIRLAGKTGRLVAEASSGGTIGLLESGRMDARDAEIHASSGGSVRVCSVDRLGGHASSGGSITSESSGLGDRSSSSGGDFSTKSCS